MGIDRRVIGVQGLVWRNRSCSPPPETMRLFLFAEKWIGTPWRQAALCGLCCINKPDTIFLSIGGPLSYTLRMKAVKIGYARCSTDKQNLAVRQAALERLRVAHERIFADQRLTDTSRAQPGLDGAPAAVRPGD